MLEAFINNEDRSLDYVNDIEYFLISNFDNDNDAQILDSLEVPLASYRPGGGYLLHNEDDLTNLFKNFLEEIRSE
jgi:hypothetical protein